MLQFFDMDNEMEPSGEDGVFGERVKYMFRAPSIVAGHKNPYADGGGPELLPNQNRGPRYAERTAHAIGTVGGTPLGIRMDGPGFDAQDVPGCASVPKLQSTTFVPTAEFFRALRSSQASLDLQEKDAVSVEDGLEGSLTAARRQNFLVPRAATAPSRRPN